MSNRAPYPSCSALCTDSRHQCKAMSSLLDEHDMGGIYMIYGMNYLHIADTVSHPS